MLILYSCPATAQLHSTNTGLHAVSSGFGSQWIDPENSHNPNGEGALSYISDVSDFYCQQTSYCKFTARLNITNFRFNIPESATITGIKLFMITYQQGTGGAFIADSAIYLIDGNQEISDNKAKLFSEGIWGGSGPRTYGSSDDLWGAALTPGIVNDRNFGISVSAQYTYFTYSVAAVIDDVVLKVFYTDSSGEKSSASNVQAEDENLSIFPNPFQQELKVMYSSKNTEPVQISVFDNVGILKFQQSWSAGELRAPIIISSGNWQNGLYWLEIAEGDKVKRELVLKLDN